jgi:hypothetical protein
MQNDSQPWPCLVILSTFLKVVGNSGSLDREQIISIHFIQLFDTEI